MCQYSKATRSLFLPRTILEYEVSNTLRCCSVFPSPFVELQLVLSLISTKFQRILRSRAGSQFRSHLVQSPYFTDVETEAQRGELTHIRSHDKRKVLKTGPVICSFYSTMMPKFEVSNLIFSECHTQNFEFAK